MAEETQVRATILRVIAEHVDRDHDAITAWWSNSFDLRGADRLPECLFDQARLDGALDARGATFSDTASFVDATFKEDAWFVYTTFSGNSSFRGATFNGVARFGGATFCGYAGFVGATFSERAGFAGVTFDDGVEFSGATFGKDIEFISATLNEVICDKAMVAGQVRRPNGTFDTPASTARPLQQALGPEDQPSS